MIDCRHILLIVGISQRQGQMRFRQLLQLQRRFAVIYRPRHVAFQKVDQGAGFEHQRQSHLVILGIGFGRVDARLRKPQLAIRIAEVFSIINLTRDGLGDHVMGFGHG